MVTSLCYQPQCPPGMQATVQETQHVFLFVAEGVGIMSSVMTPSLQPYMWIEGESRV